MGLVCKWLIPQRVVIQFAVGNVTSGDIGASLIEIREMVTRGQPLVHVLLDGMNVKSVPPSVNDIKGAVQISSHASLGWVVSASNNRIAQFLIAVGAHLIDRNIRIRSHSTLESAIRFLLEQDSTLNTDFETLMEQVQRIRDDKIPAS